eukprot:8538430-Heterocapsa_arctica.AAC.1
MVIAMMPEDRSKTSKNRQKPSKPCKAIYTCMCTPGGPAEIQWEIAPAAWSSRCSPVVAVV